MGAGDKKWDAVAERDLSVAIILASQEGKSYNWPKVHEMMCQMNYVFTKDAISQHFTKVIMKDFKSRNGNLSKTGGAPATPKKGAATPGKRKASSARSAKSAKYVDEDSDDDEKGTPTGPTPKKTKKDEANKDEVDEETASIKKEYSTRASTRARSRTIGFDDEDLAGDDDAVSKVLFPKK